MLASLRACAHQVSQPVWGLCGPHDAGSYKLWPHQTGFFANHVRPPAAAEQLPAHELQVLCGTACRDSFKHA
jgi:hypothetical protein